VTISAATTFRISTRVVLAFVFVARLAAQDDVTTHNAPSAYGGAYITGPASNPLSFLNGPAYRTYASTARYDFPDFRPASRLDDRLPGWVRFGVEERLRIEGFCGGGPNRKDSGYTLLRQRYQLNIEPVSWLKLVAQAQDARSFFQQPPYGPPNQSRWDLKLAYAEIGDPEEQWYSLRVGRQLLNFNNTILADSQWRNQGRSYDAVVLNLHFDRVRAGVFAASVVNPLASGLSHHLEGNNIYGIYGNVDGIVPASSFEPFVLWRVAPAVAVEGAGNLRTGRLDEKAVGLRFKGRALGELDYSLEVIAERGSAGPDNLTAYGATGGAGYRFDHLPWHPRYFAQADYASGDKDPTDGHRGTFDTMYPTAHDRFGIMDQFAWQNIVAVRSGVTVEPHRRWSVTGQYLDFWLASESDALYNSSGIVVWRDLNGRSGRHIGEEIDVYSWYELNRHVNIGGGFGHIFPGGFLANAKAVPTYNYTYFGVNFKDDGGCATQKWVTCSAP
jgi:hypothetical protein